MFVSLILLLAWQAQPDLAESHGKEWSWRYECYNGNCYRNATPMQTSAGDPSASIGICRLFCGEYGSLWPRPRRATLGKRLVPTHPSLVEFNFVGVSGEDIQKKFLARAAKRLLESWDDTVGASGRGSPPKNLVNVKIQTSSPDMDLSLNTDERYSLTVSLNGDTVEVCVNATTIYGARNGLETLGQLGEPWGGKLWLLADATVDDSPTYSHRGVLLDTSRHFLPLDAIKRTLDAMASSKLNVLHWHATDSHSFPVVFKSLPEMSVYGAYSNKEVYTTKDIRHIIEYAKDRGIRIMFELDTPSHSGNGWQWGESAGLGRLAVCVNEVPWTSYCVQPPCGQLNPVNNNVYLLLGKMYKEIQNLFSTENMFHMGGDEVHFPCWNSTREITDWMKEKGMGRTKEDFLKLWGIFQDEALKQWDSKAGHSKTPIVLWSSHLTEPLVIEKYLDPKRYVIETWVDSIDNLPQILLSKGYKLILVIKDAWYFDHGFDGNNNYHTWKTAYESKIDEHEGVLGGEGCMWGELVDDVSLDNKLWPRAAALAERLWVNPTTMAYQAQPRLLQQNERLLRMGVKPSPITPKWCFQNDGLC